ncbi:MAG: hypothetical protein P4L73_11895 [Caulobacteraceae bacterium]|nr:hypothetical protein [Caulobacteraceae bacterium]
MSEVVIERRFAGPPSSGNGGYVSGLLARAIAGPATVVLRAIIPLDTPLDLSVDDGRAVLSDAAGGLIGEAKAADVADLPQPPTPPSLAAAEAAGRRAPSLERNFHPICFTCSVARAEGDGLRILAGQLEGAPAGVLAGVWTPDPAFADDEGRLPEEIVWAAVDCPGSFAWWVREQHHGGLLGTMTAEVIRRPSAGEPHIVLAWPIEGGAGRKRFSGVALFTAEGELLARGRQVWISFPQPAREAA